MTEEELDKAISLKEEIKELNRFITYAETVWTGSIIKRDTKFIFKSHAFGGMNSQEYEMDTEVKNEVLDVLRKRLDRLKNELASI